MTTPTDTAKLADEIEALAKERTCGGEWEPQLARNSLGLTSVYNAEGSTICGSVRPIDAALIVALVNSAPTIIAALRELEAAHAREAKLREALEPFAKAAELFPDEPPLFDMWVYKPVAGKEFGITAQHLRRARAALGGAG